MKPLGLILVWSIVGAVGIRAQKAPAFSAHLSQDSVLLGHYLKVTFTLENADGRSFVARISDRRSKCFPAPILPRRFP
ncbi:MAG: hypothetical protein IPK21_01740 [Haliscomenobacter sp.]|nr:hypothetical protein [Haliscomenobacter sp.]